MAGINLEDYMDEKKVPIEHVIKFLMANPRPTDQELHQWATENGHEPEKVEEFLYALVATSFKKLFKWIDEPDESFDPEQLQIGIEVEKEHTDNEFIAKMIAKAHLKECADYYKMLKKVEDLCKSKTVDVAALEGLIDGKKHREVEYTFYGKIADMSQLTRAIQKEEHEQWSIDVETEADIRLRIRAINGMRWVLTSKVRYTGVVGCEEVECDISKDMFDHLKFFASGGMKKTRYVFKIDGTEKVWEVDVFKDINGQDHPWVKVDLEVTDPNDKTFPRLPVNFVKGEFIARQTPEQTDEEKSHISALWSKEWVSLDESQRLNK